jgi:hypothetical protein
MKFVALSEQKEWHGAERTRPKAEQMASSCCVVKVVKTYGEYVTCEYVKCDAVVVITDRGRLVYGLVRCLVFVRC